MKDDFFFRNNNMSIILEACLPQYNSLEKFEEHFPKEFLDDDSRTGDHLQKLLNKYDKDASAVSKKAGLSFSYVGLIVRKDDSGRIVNLEKDDLEKAKKYMVRMEERQVSQGTRVLLDSVK